VAGEWLAPPLRRARSNILERNFQGMPNKVSDERRWLIRSFREQEDTFVNFIAAFVPAMIAFAMVGAALYLMITAPATPLPNFLVNSLTMILGYYFGIGIAQCHNDKGG
jgi:hypothetical protein